MKALFPKAALPGLVLALLAFLPQQDATAKEEARPAVGQTAPLFRLNDHLGKAVAPLASDDDEQLWTVLAFYPKAFTGG